MTATRRLGGVVVLVFAIAMIIAVAAGPASAHGTHCADPDSGTAVPDSGSASSDTGTAGFCHVVEDGGVDYGTGTVGGAGGADEDGGRGLPSRIDAGAGAMAGSGPSAAAYGSTVVGACVAAVVGAWRRRR